MPIRVLTRPLIVLIGALLLGWQVLAVTINGVFAHALPGVALFWAPGSADANVALADQLLQADPARPDPRIAALAARSLARQPVNPGAARLLAVVASQHGDERRAASLLRYSEAMSRRDVTAQLMLIQQNVARGDVPAVLRHYNRALDSNDAARAALIPILAKAADEPAIWRPLVPLLASRPQWTREFLLHYVPGAKAPGALYAIARALRLDRAPTPDATVLQSMEKRLVDLGAFAQAAALYNRAHGLPADDRTPVRNGGFEQPGNWDPFDWNLVDDQDLAAVRQPSPAANGGTALFLSATNGRGGEMAVQLTMLPPGRYTVSATVGGVRGDPLAFPQLAIRCVQSGKEVLQAPFPPAPDSGRPWRLPLTVPADCRAQRIILRGTSALDAQPASPWIDNLAITRQAGS